MFDRNSDSIEVYLEVVRLGINHGHSVESCTHEVQNLEFIAEFPPARTTGGLIDMVREWGFSAAQYGFAHICSHKYLRDLFVQDVLDDFIILGASHPTGGIMLRYCVPELPEEADRLAPRISDSMRIRLEANKTWSDFSGE